MQVPQFYLKIFIVTWCPKLNLVRKQDVDEKACSETYNKSEKTDIHMLKIKMTLRQGEMLGTPLSSGIV